MYAILWHSYIFLTWDPFITSLGCEESEEFKFKRLKEELKEELKPDVKKELEVELKEKVTKSAEKALFNNLNIQLNDLKEVLRKDIDDLRQEIISQIDNLRNELQLKSDNSLIRRRNQIKSAESAFEYPLKLVSVT